MDEDVSANQFANGRFSIFKAYLSQLNWTGHEEMGAVLPDGSLAVHAHNIFLQISFDHGILTGLLFLVFSILTLLETLLYAFRSFRLCKETGEEGKLCFLPFALSVAFYTTGMAEWISHMCNPLAAAFLLALLPVMLDK
ncbi:MAG: hypothetical protein IJU50_09065 [Lachnospiraceae bacterium]|nr:hypothetical protein [Lachnospiraceae bacterium]